MDLILRLIAPLAEAFGSMVVNGSHSLNGSFTMRTIWFSLLRGEAEYRRVVRLVEEPQVAQKPGRLSPALTETGR